MAPTVRTHTQTRRGNRAGYQEHDDFEGLPVRQWRQEWVSIAPPPPVETTQKNDVWAIELPHGMPKDSNLLPTHTQELLRAARSGRLYKRPAPAEEEEAEADAAPEKPDKKEEDPAAQGFMVKVWKQIPRNAEGPTISHLAKRRKGTVTLSSDLPAGAPSGPTVTKATVRRIDAAGNPYTQTVTLAEGQSVDGEIISTTVVAAPNVHANPENAAATPVRRRPPPPKRKAKGPGRGRKKKLPLPLPARPDGAGVSGAEGAEGGVKPEGAADGIKQEGDNDDSKNQDSEMADGDDDEEGDDDGDDGDEGEEGDEDEGDVPDSEKGTPAGKESSVDQEIKDSPSVEPFAITAPAVDPDAMDISTDESPSGADQVQPLNTSIPPIQPPPHLTPSRIEGSPLKVVSMPSPTEIAATHIPPVPATEDPEPSVPDVQSAMVSDAMPAPAEPVEETLPPVPAEPAPQKPQEAQAILETQEVQPAPETAVIETEAPADVEMADSTPTQDAPVHEESIVETKILSSTETDAGRAVVEEIVETTTIPLKDEVPAAEVPLVEETTVVSETQAPPTIEEAPKAPSPIVEEPEQPVSIVEDLAPQTTSDQIMEETSEPAPETAPEQPPPTVAQITELTEHSTLPALDAPAPVDKPALSLPPLNPVQTGAAASLLIAEEREPESPDLLGGLEAALDRHSESKTEPGPAESVAESTADPIVEPAAERAAESAAEPAAEPIVEPAAEPTVEPTAEAASEPAVEPAGVSAAEPSTEAAAEPTTVPAASVPDVEATSLQEEEKVPEAKPEETTG
ncbi:hypothetical protein JX266_002740 [Neoarthrinium moseri]|uniref:uncharacterized protein n=1 Tax=Neoarthrinium moseri TaxID=1658444 RepID=UPI001FDC39EC|nr:uncharacterized protein JN550_005005 [Neoarthrinium moseri]KAI1851887.1 hypothetical protein JX266_002740 [Neoarthrinium moseri]KAI1870859.1 hypothetical protein JN550_005005 [Neoarthrinium moseri]